MRLYLFLFLLPFSLINAQVFEADWEQAKGKARSENKTLLLVFSGSDWCIPCIKLEKEVWKDSHFQAYAGEKYVMYRADFPKRKKNQLPQNLKIKHQNLAEKYNPDGYFPYVIVFDSSLEPRAYFGYQKKDVAEYIKQIDGR